MSKEPEETSIFDVVEKVEKKPIREPILPYGDWIPMLKEKGELMVYVLYDKKDIEKFGFKKERMNKDVFLRSTVYSGLWKIGVLGKFKTPLYWASGKHKKSNCAVIVVSTKERLESHGFDAKLIKKHTAKRKRKLVEVAETPAPTEPAEPSQIEVEKPETEKKPLKIE